MSIRDLLSWVHFINRTACRVNQSPTSERHQLEPAAAYIHGAAMVFLDALGAGMTNGEVLGILMCTTSLKPEIMILYQSSNTFSFRYVPIPKEINIIEATSYIAFSQMLFHLCIIYVIFTGNNTGSVESTCMRTLCMEYLRSQISTLLCTEFSLSDLGLLSPDSAPSQIQEKRIGMFGVHPFYINEGMQSHYMNIFLELLFVYVHLHLLV